jgi:predicted RNase H-like HicB family nuclease
MKLDRANPQEVRMRELFFDAREDKVDGGYTASAIGLGIHTQAETLEELRANILDAVDCYFDEPSERPTVIHLRVVSEEVLVG